MPLYCPSRAHRHRPAGWIIAVLAVGLLTPADLWAGTGTVIHLPRPGRKVKSGLRVTVDTTWVEGNGYRPVQVTVTPSPPIPLTADREIRVELWPNSNTESDGIFCASRYIELPEGSTGVTTTVWVPLNQTWNRLRVEIWEDGRLLKDLSMPDGAGINNNSINNWINNWYDANNWPEGLPRMLVIDPDAPSRQQRRMLMDKYRSGTLGKKLPTSHRLYDIRGLADLLLNINNSNMQQLPNTKKSDEQKIDDLSLLSELSSMSHIELLPPADLPEHWIGYTCFDFVFISLPDLKQMAASQPRRWEALRAWAAAGSTLCVFGVGQDFARLKDLEKLVDLPAAQGEPENNKKYPGWTAPPSHLFGQEVEYLQTYRDYQQQRSGMVQSTATATPNTASNSGEEEKTGQTSPAQAPKSPTFLWRKLNLGQIVAMGPEDVFPGSSDQWNWLLNSLGPERWAWYQRHGLSMTRENGDYWNFLIPGVGLAPVNAFRVMITLFVIVIGPVNYFVLRRWRRLHWLLVTVPLGATLITGGLFTYALVTDGLGVRVRVRSFTEIDQRQGRAVCWSRQSYYAGLAPSRGLSFPDDVAVYPLDHLPPNEYFNQYMRRHLAWGAEQNLRSGYLTSRVISQFMTVRSRRTTSGLSVEESPDGKTSPKIVNRLGTRILKLLVRDSQGNYYWAENVDNQATSRPRPRKLADAMPDLRKVITENKPRLPEGFVPEDYQNSMMFGSRHYFFSWNNGLDASLPEPTVNRSLLETNLRNIHSSGQWQLEPRSYLAITERPPAAPLGITQAREEASFHIILGRW